MTRLLWALPLLLVGCASHVDLGNGQAMKTVLTDSPELFATNGGFMQLQECDKTKDPNTGLFDYSKNCVPKSNWIPISSQGVGGHIVGGALTGIGAGVGGVMVDTGNSVIQSVVTAPTKGKY